MSEKEVYDILLMAMFALAPIVFILLLFIPAAYGRYGEGRAAAWGPSINVKVGWMIQGTPALSPLPSSLLWVNMPPTFSH